MHAGSDSTAPRGRRWTAADRAGRALRLLRQRSFRPLVFGVLGETVYRRLVLTSRRLDEPIRRADCALPLEFSFLAPDELHEYAAVRRDQESGEPAARLRRGERCWTARLDGRIVNVRWVTTVAAPIDYLGITLALAADEAYIYDEYTSPEHRRLGVAAVASMRLAHVLADEGHERVLTAALPENTVALHMREKAGYRRAGVIRSFRIGPWRRVFVRRAS